MRPVLVDRRQLREVALTPDEYVEIVDKLGRKPNRVELGMLGVLWSEHCSYKTSKPLLRQLPTQGPHVLEGPGENAGAVEIGEGWVVVFKVESHNHPSAIEPYQGAATGVGGILRDVIAMGARPIALLDSLRFGPLPDSRHHLEGVVAGIGGYGNCVGVPTVGGEVYFDDCYAGNPLVNAMCVGLVRTEQLKSARAEGAGHLMLLVGAQTGRDGIHGASFASLELDRASEERRPAVQVGNPFLEKCLLEACMEALTQPGLVAIQDLGAAGLTSAIAELAARSGAGARVDLARVPRRERRMTAYEVMLSESQERMLIVAERGREGDLAGVFSRWDLEASVVGELTDDGDLVVVDRLKEVARLPVRLLTDGAPVRMLEGRPPTQQSTGDHPDRLLVQPADMGAVLIRLMSSPNLGSRRPIFRRYDHMVGGATVIPPGGDAAVVRVPACRLGLAVTIDGNGRYCRLDPYVGGQIAVAEAARNVVATGARPLAVTDCLNFGNPERSEVYWQLREAIAGISAACRALSVPVVSGNVSLYNESEGRGPIDPTPVIGMIGLLSDYGDRLDPAFKSDGDFVLLVGETDNDLDGSEYLRLVHGELGVQPPTIDLARERASHGFVLAAASAGLLRSAHDVAEGGMLVALAECCLLGGRGVHCGGLRPDEDVRLDAGFFGESQGRFVISTRPRSMPELQALARRHHVELALLGLTGGEAVEFDGQLRVDLAELRRGWESALLNH
ncbi:MAG TPA: phosphoribosylformylglycinamidine synthase subunit PurL [Candidatus Dormibacteraeota bacterium]|nr:phosphoribosylformylglycinamidine synthase subunit PurL [Candidatus Dormibacteraeota bacterium]